MPDRIITKNSFDGNNLWADGRAISEKKKVHVRNFSARNITPISLTLFLGSASPRTGSPGPFGHGTPEESEKSPKSTPGQGPKSAERVRTGVSRESEKSPEGACPRGTLSGLLNTFKPFRSHRGLLF